MRRALARARDGKPLDQAEAAVLLHARGDDLRMLLGYARRTRDAGLEAAAIFWAFSVWECCCQLMLTERSSAISDAGVAIMIRLLAAQMIKS